MKTYVKKKILPHDDEEGVGGVIRDLLCRALQSGGCCDVGQVVEECRTV